MSERDAAARLRRGVAGKRDADASRCGLFEQQFKIRDETADGLDSFDAMAFASSANSAEVRGDRVGRAVDDFSLDRRERAGGRILFGFAEDGRRNGNRVDRSEDERGVCHAAAYAIEQRLPDDGGPRLRTRDDRFADRHRSRGAEQRAQGLPHAVGHHADRGRRQRRSRLEAYAPNSLHFRRSIAVLPRRPLANSAAWSASKATYASFSRMRLSPRSTRLRSRCIGAKAAKSPWAAKPICGATPSGATPPPPAVSSRVAAGKRASTMRPTTTRCDSRRPLRGSIVFRR